jgi:nucleolar protein 58
LKAFRKFKSTADAVSACSAVVEGKINSDLKKFLKKAIDEKERLSETLAVADSKLGASIAKKLGISVVSDSSVNELMRGIRSQLTSLITGLPESQLAAMSLGLAHSLSRYKLKFSADKVDTMIIQAIALLDDLDKELNTYAMRVKEWFGWHFPEMGKVVADNLMYARCVLKMDARREKCSETTFDDILPEEMEKQVKDLAEISMGTEISEEDMLSIRHLCHQIISLFEYRAQLYEYLKNRMMAIAPNLTTLVGDLVGARLISHAGSLLNLAKHPASTVQILGAEKALFRALKAKKDTPKYGLIYHASLVGQAGQKLKGKMARMVAAKAALATRVDALTEPSEENPSAEIVPELGLEQRAKLESQLRRLEGRAVHAVVKDKSNTQQFKKSSASPVNLVSMVPAAGYNAQTDNTITSNGDAAESPSAEKTKEKKKKSKEEKAEKKKKRKLEDDGATVSEAVVEDGEKKKHKKKKHKATEESS